MTRLEMSQDALRERGRDLSQAFVIGASDPVGYHAGVWTLISGLLSSMQTQNQIVYFIRQAPVPITPENFEATVQFGTVRGSYIPALLRLLSGVFAPQIFANATWPESIRNHFASHLHRFLACLTGEQKTPPCLVPVWCPTDGRGERGGWEIPPEYLCGPARSRCLCVFAERVGRGAEFASRYRYGFLPSTVDQIRSNVELGIS